MKKCTLCKKKLRLTKFHKNPLTKDGRGSLCKRCDLLQKTRRSQEKKLLAVKSLGGKCVRCGYDKCLAALEFHHQDPNKDVEVSSLRRRTLDKILEEVRKCTLLCANCHREEHYTDLGPVQGKRRTRGGCGTSTGYKVCGPPKCRKCQEYKRRYMNKYRSGGRGGN